MFLLPNIESSFCYSKLKESNALFYRKYDDKDQRIMFLIVLCLYFVGCYFSYSFAFRMPSYVFEQGMVFPLTFAVEEYYKNFTATFAKLNPNHIFFSMAIQLKRIDFFTEPASVNISIDSQFMFFNNFDFDFAENSSLSNIIIEFSTKDIISPLSLFYIKQGVNFTNFDAAFEIFSQNFSGITSARIVTYTMNANTWKFTSLFRIGVFIATSYFLFGVLLCYDENHDYPLHKELLIILIAGFLGINIFQTFATRKFLWFRYSYLMSTIFYTCYRIYMIKFLYLLKDKEFIFSHQNILKWIGYITLILIELIEISDVVIHSSNSYWLYDPNDKKSTTDIILYIMNFYYCVFMFFLITKIYIYTKASTDEIKNFFTAVIASFFLISIVFNFYVECYCSFFNHLRKTTLRFFLESFNAYLVIFALSFIHNTRCIKIPKLD